MSVSALHYDDRVINHEACHAVVAFAEGFELTAVLANRHASFMMDCHGVVEFVPTDDASLERLCRVTISGNVGSDVFSGADARRSMELWSASGREPDWLLKREAEVRALLRRQARAYTALAHLLAREGGNVAGFRAKPVLEAAWII